MATASLSGGSPGIFSGGQNQTFDQTHVQAAGRDFVQTVTFATKISHFHFGLFRKSKKKKKPEADEGDQRGACQWFWQSQDGYWAVRGMDNAFQELAVGNSNMRSRGQSYVRNMITYGLGRPCWDPRRYSPYIPEMGISPGDVGTFDSVEGFSKLFNLWEDLQAIAGLVANSLPQREIVVHPNELKKGDTITYGASASVSPTLDSFNFNCVSSEGAMLAITSPVESQLLSKKSKRELHNAIIQTPAALYTHAYQVTHMPPNESLYIVTGCFKSENWAMAGYFNPMPHGSNMLTLHQNKPLDDVEHYVWTNRGTAQTVTSHGGCRPGIQDQPLFLQGFTLSIHSSAYPIVTGALETGGRLPRSGSSGSSGGWSDGGSGSDRNTPNDGGGSGDSSDGHWSGGSNSPSDASGPRDGDSSIEELVRQLKTNNPSDFMNQTLLIETGSSFAITHDDEWRHVLKGHRWDKDGLVKLIDALDSRPISVSNGVAFFPGDDDHLDIGSLTLEERSSSHIRTSAPPPRTPSHWTYPSRLRSSTSASRGLLPSQPHPLRRSFTSHSDGGGYYSDGGYGPTTSNSWDSEATSGEATPTKTDEDSMMSDYTPLHRHPFSTPVSTPVESAAYQPEPFDLSDMDEDLFSIPEFTVDNAINVFKPRTRFIDFSKPEKESRPLSIGSISQTQTEIHGIAYEPPLGV